MNIRSTSASIRLDAVTKSYDGRVRAVDDVTLDIRPGELTEIVASTLSTLTAHMPGIGR